MTHKSIKPDARVTPWSLLRRYFGAQRFAPVAVFALMIVETGLALTIPQVVRTFIDQLQEGARSTALVRSALLFLLLVLVQIPVRLSRSGLHNHLAWTATNALRHDLLSHVLGLDLRFHAAHTPGDLLERIDGDVKRLNRFFSELLPEISGAVILALGTLIALAFDDWRLSVILAAFLAAFILIHRWDQQLAEPVWQKERQYAADVAGFVEERVSAVVDIHTSGAVAHTLGQFHHRLRRHALQGLRGEVVTDSAWAISRAFYALGFALAMGVGAGLFLRGRVGLGVVYLVVQYLQLLWGPMTRIGDQLEDLTRARVSLRRIGDLLDERTALQPGRDYSFLPDAPVAILVDKVSFGYGPQHQVLRDISFSLEPGETLGLLGRTGSGKTTLARLLVRFYDVDNGAIRFDGVDVRDFELVGLRRGIALVTQEVRMLHASVRDNIALFREDIRDGDIVEALQALGLGDWLANASRGLDTVLAPDGGGLSAGEAQLMAIPRAFMEDPGLVILDEASSRVDPLTQARLDGAIEKLLENRTAVIIAHRLSTIRHVDKVLILDRGRVAEYGTYAALVADPASMLSQLLQTCAEEVLV